jgi:hypothetical protein
MVGLDDIGEFGIAMFSFLIECICVTINDFPKHRPKVL